MSFWSPGFWAAGFWSAGFWGDAVTPPPSAGFGSGGGPGFAPRKRRENDEALLLCGVI